MSSPSGTSGSSPGPTPPRASGSLPGLAQHTRGATDPFVRRAPSRLSWDRVGPVLAVAAGGAAGGAARFGVAQALPRGDVRSLPWATLTVNVSGAFVLAVLMVLILELWPPRRYVRPFFCVGVLGAFTTFSSLSVEVDRLAADGAPLTAAAYLVLTMAAGFAAAALGLLLGHRITRRDAHRDDDPEEAW